MRDNRSTTAVPWNDTSLVLGILMVGLCYYIGGSLGLALPFLGTFISLIWIPSGIAYGSFIRWGRKLWPGVFLGSLAVNLTFSWNLPQGFAIAAGSTLGPLVAVTLLRRAQFHMDFPSRRDLALFCSIAPLSLLIPALIGATSVVASGDVPQAEFMEAATYWWLGDLTGLLLVAPFILSVSREALAPLRESPWTSIAVLATILMLSLILFRPFDAESTIRPTTVFLALPIVAWAAIRCGSLGGTLAALLISSVAVTCTFLDRGPFRPDASGSGLLELWSYMATAALVGMTFTALRAEGARARDEALSGRNMLEQLAKLQAEFLVTADAKVAFDQILGIIQNKTRSPFGFLALVIEGRNGQPAIRMLSITDIAWNAHSRRMRDLHDEGRLEFHNMLTLFGAAVTSGEPVISNAPAEDSRSAGTPEDHPPLNSFAALPIHSSGKIVGLLGLANRSGGYEPDFASTQDAYITACAALIQSHLNSMARLETEERLRESEGRLQMALGASNMGTWEWDLSPGGIIWDEGHARLFGMELVDFDGRFETVLAAVVPTDRVLMENSIKNASPERPNYDQEYRVRHKNGEIRWLSSKGRLTFDAQGQLISMTGVITDVTGERESELQRRELEVQLRQSQKMEAIGNLAGGIAHDFNNILSAIIGNAELAKDTMNSDTLVQECLDDVLTASMRARDLVQRILTFARRQENEKEKVNLEGVVREAVALLRSTIPATISVEVDIDEDCPCVIADITQVHQVIVNLLTNAWQALKGRQGQIRVRLNRSQVRYPVEGFHGSLSAGEHVVLSVADNGPGIDPENVERIFEPFFSTKKVGEGTGLGLSVVHGIVMAHDAYLSLNTELGKGSEFHVYFKAESGPSDLPRLVAATGEVLMLGRRILLIDDEPAIGKVISSILERRGVEVLLFVDPRAALDAFQENAKDFDLIVTDLSMPGLSGIELLELLRKSEFSIPAILMTGHLDQNNAARLKEMDCVSAILKPFSPQELVALIERLLASQGSIA